MVASDRDAAASTPSGATNERSVMPMIRAADCETATGNAIPKMVPYEMDFTGIPPIRTKKGRPLTGALSRSPGGSESLQRRSIRIRPGAWRRRKETLRAANAGMRAKTGDTVRLSAAEATTRPAPFRERNASFRKPRHGTATRPPHQERTFAHGSLASRNIPPDDAFARNKHNTCSTLDTKREKRTIFVLRNNFFVL